MSRMIERDDYYEIRRLAKKYNMSVADFGRSIVRQAERNVPWAIRLTEAEYKYIKETAAKCGVTASRFCALACHAFLNEESKKIPLGDGSEDGVYRDKRLKVRFYNGAEEVEVIKIANENSMAVSALIRYCAVKFNGENIDLEGE